MIIFIVTNSKTKWLEVCHVKLKNYNTNNVIILFRNVRCLWLLGICQLPKQGSHEIYNLQIHALTLLFKFFSKLGMNSLTSRAKVLEHFGVCSFLDQSSTHPHRNDKKGLPAHDTPLRPWSEDQRRDLKEWWKRRKKRVHVIEWEDRWVVKILGWDITTKNLRAHP